MLAPWVIDEMKAADLNDARLNGGPGDQEAHNSQKHCCELGIFLMLTQARFR